MVVREATTVDTMSFESLAEAKVGNSNGKPARQSGNSGPEEPASKNQRQALNELENMLDSLNEE